MKDYLLEKYYELYRRYIDFDETKIPLCAAETYVSDFVKEPLLSAFEGKYCMNNRHFNIDDDFIGSQYINELFKLLNEACLNIFQAKYGDARTLSGMNCMAITASSLFKPGDKVLITSADQGGHASVPLLLSLYGIEFETIPYDYEKNDINYGLLNKLLRKNKYSGIIFAQSDLLQPADVSKIHITNEIIIYDATQTLGFIASRVHKNPLLDHGNVVLIGGTHKTLPGPTCGLIMTNNNEYIEILDDKITPAYLRNTQPNNIASVLFTLIEHQYIGLEYQTLTIANANYLAKKLEEKRFVVGKINDNIYTKTHQVFLYTSEREMNIIYNNARTFGITLNKKSKKMFKGNGIRIGVQEISRYKWTHDDLDILTDIISHISKEHPNIDYIKMKIAYLIENKTNKFVFDDFFTI